MADNNDILLEKYNYHLPPELIAQEPLSQRDNSRLMVIKRNTGVREHRFFYELPLLLDQGDLIVMNDTRVIPARLLGIKEKTKGKVEVLLLERLSLTYSGRERWRAMVKPGKRALPGDRLCFEQQLKAVIEELDVHGNRIVRFETKHSLDDWLQEIGNIPLPPYIKKDIKNPEKYQTVYSQKKGSVAAPTAGFHFTNRLFQKLDEKGVERVYLTLHVGPGTFLPVKTQDIRDHHMHREYFVLPQNTTDKINLAKKEKRRVIAVGTTSCRVLEAMTNKEGTVEPGESWTELFIYPGYRFRVIDGLLTNFHLPCSTLLMLVSAFAGRRTIIESYKEAVEKGYRFYSFGDATLMY